VITVHYLLILLSVRRRTTADRRKKGVSTVGLQKNYSHGFSLVKHACSKMHCDASVVFAKY